MRVYNRVKKDFIEISDDYYKAIRICKKVERCKDCVYYIENICRGRLYSENNVIYPFELDIV